VTAPQRRRGSSTAHGGSSGAPVPGGLKARPQAWKQGKGTTQRKARLRLGSRWVDDVVITGLTKVAAPGRRTQRRSASCAAPASRSTRTLHSSRGDRSGSTCSRPTPSSGASAAMQHTVLLSPPPLSPFPRGGAHKKGKTPSGLVWRG
jgi:hypothetical protein